MKNKTIKILSSFSDQGKRLDIFLSEKFNEVTRSNIKKLIKSGKVSLNNNIVDNQSKKIKDKDEIIINFHQEDFKKIKPSHKPIDIIYEDRDLMVINKPQGMVVHPGAGNKNDTLVNILVGSYKKNCLI